jgi:hypothetical protein
MAKRRAKIDVDDDPFPGVPAVAQLPDGPVVGTTEDPEFFN